MWNTETKPRLINFTQCIKKEKRESTSSGGGGAQRTGNAYIQLDELFSAVTVTQKRLVFLVKFSLVLLLLGNLLLVFCLFILHSQSSVKSIWDPSLFYYFSGFYLEDLGPWLVNFSLLSQSSVKSIWDPSLFYYFSVLYLEALELLLADSPLLSRSSVKRICDLLFFSYLLFLLSGSGIFSISLTSRSFVKRILDVALSCHPWTTAESTRKRLHKPGMSLPLPHTDFSERKRPKVSFSLTNKYNLLEFSNIKRVYLNIIQQTKQTRPNKRKS